MKGLHHANCIKESLRRNSASMLLLLASLFLALCIGEVIARYRHKAWPFEKEMMTFPNLTARDKNLRWRIPQKQGKYSLGFRTSKIEKKRKNQFRILFLGDSLLWDSETSSGELYTQTIERNLNRELKKDDREIEVVNAGVPGYTTYQELELLKIYGWGMQPDSVILAFVFNDVYYKYLNRPTDQMMLDIDATRMLHRFDTRSFPGIFFARSYLAHDLFFASETLVKKIAGHPHFPFDHNSGFYLAWKDHGWDETRALIGEMHELLEKRRVPLIIIIYPMIDQVDDAYLTIDEDYVLYPQKRIKDICNDYGIPFLDLTDPLRANGGPDVYRDFVHLNSKGNDTVAVEVTRYLLDNTSIWFD